MKSQLDITVDSFGAYSAYELSNTSSFPMGARKRVQWERVEDAWIDWRVIDNLALVVHPWIGEEVRIGDQEFMIVERDLFSGRWRILRNTPEAHRRLMWMMERAVEEAMLRNYLAIVCFEHRQYAGTPREVD